MKLLYSSVLLIGCVAWAGQTRSVFDLPGIVELVDQPPEATPVEAISFRLHPFDGGFEIEAHPDRAGRFVLKNVRPGRYSLTYPTPGRIVTFADGPKQLAPEGFDLSASSRGPLRLVISMKTSVVSVQVRAFPSRHSDVIAVLVPADTYLTLRESSSYNPLSGPQTTFADVPPGKYRIIVIDAALVRVAAYASRFPDFLKKEATSVNVSAARQAETTATYVDAEAVKEAIQQACPEILKVWPHDPFEPLCRGK